MLKNKRMTYLLIALVALIWGLVFYKIYSNFGGKKQVAKNVQQSVVKIDNGQSDSIFTLLLNYTDPFLKGSGLPTGIPILSGVKNNSITQIINWPLIEYRGLLTSKNDCMGLLKIQSSDILVKQGKVYSSVKIRAITKDSIFLEYQKESHWLRITKNSNY